MLPCGTKARLWSHLKIQLEKKLEVYGLEEKVCELRLQTQFGRLMVKSAAKTVINKQRR
jgi:hypothetical protein